MIYLSAQPARYYFVWQLKIQLFNFTRLGIKKNQIHVLFGHRINTPIDKRVLKFVKDCNSANFFFYDDTRPPSFYEPTIRPHIIKKHLNCHPELENEAIFYHDCDIIFRELPNFKKMLRDNKWYMSNADSYIGASHLSSLNLNVFHKMMEIVGVEKKQMLDLVASGGAQSLVKNTNYAFWDKVERDSNTLFDYLKNEHQIFTDKYHKAYGCSNNSKLTYIQAWCADMWAILWNGLLFNNDVLISDELDFCWARDNSKRWFETKIMHNAGISFSDSHTYFYKGSFIDKDPFETKFDYVDKDSCSQKYIEEMELYMRCDKFNLKNASFLIIVRIDSPERLINLQIVVNYLTKYFTTQVYILEADSSQHIKPNSLSNRVIYEFIEDKNLVFDRAKYNNILLKKCSTEVAIIQDADVIIDIKQLIEGVNLVHKNKLQMVCPYDGDYVEIEKSKSKFAETLDLDVLKTDKQASRIIYTPLGGCVIVNRNWYKSKGFENKLITGYGPDDIERVVRTIISGGKFGRLKGDLFHLSHPRLENSFYSIDFENRFDQLLKITKMHKNAIDEYVENNLL